MACDAIARLYDVDEDSVIFRKLQKTEKYDQGTVTFHARKGKLIDLGKLHESLWATRLSGGTRSGLVTLEVTAVGRVMTSAGRTVLRVADSDAEFVLARNPDHAAAFVKLQAVAESKVVKLTGRIDNYKGRWPGILRAKPPTPRRILVKEFEVVASATPSEGS